MNELASQIDDEGDEAVSWACIKYRCKNSNDKTQIAYIRIWMQIPYFGTEIDDQELMDKKSDITPRLLGWRREQQDEWGLVPSGFLVSLAWEKVPGMQLGDQFGSDAFWNLDEDERNRVRDAFKVTIPKIERIGYKPLFATPRNLVWDPTSNTLYDSLGTFPRV
ncbi:unnamed protein product [Penicillium discolor]